MSAPSVTDGAFSAVALRRAIHAADLPVAEVARQLGVPGPKVHAVLAGHHHMPAFWLERLPLAVLLPLLAPLTEQRGLGLGLIPEDRGIHSDIRTLASVVKEAGEAASAFAEAIEDGVITAGEADRIEREADEAIRPLVALKRRAREVRRERVTGVRVA